MTTIKAEAVKEILETAGFTSDTYVQMEDGRYDHIERIKAGDKVLSRCALTGEVACKKVLKTFEHEDMPCYYVKYLKGRGIDPVGVVNATEKQLFWVRGKGWMAVCDLQSGDELESDDETRTTITSVLPTPYETYVYNLHVEDFHTYFVGSSSVWVHGHVAAAQAALRVKHSLP